jgi:hypothetical protein
LNKTKKRATPATALLFTLTPHLSPSSFLFVFFADPIGIQFHAMAKTLSTSDEKNEGV